MLLPCDRGVVSCTAVALLCALVWGGELAAAGSPQAPLTDADWSAGDADADGNFMVSPDAAQDFVVPAEFEVLDLTRETQRIPGQAAKYMVLSSRVVRPGQPFRLSVSILRSRLPVTVRAALYRDSVRLDSVQKDCTAENMELLQIPVPNNSGPGRYELLTEANELDQLEGTLFKNRTLLRFEPRSLTMLVQMDSPVYRQLQTVRFRVILLGTDLMSFKSSADVELLDPNGVVMKRWMSTQSSSGLVAAEYALGERPVPGTWWVRVSARGQVEQQPFVVERYQPARFEVLVLTPPLLRTSDLDLHALVSANYTAGGGRVTGRLTLLAEAAPMRRRGGFSARQVVIHTLHAFTGRHEFTIEMSRLRGLLQPLDGAELKVTAQLVDSALQVTGQGHSITRVYGDQIQLRFLGGVSQRFRPHMPFRAHLVAFMSDGSRLAADRLIEHRLDVQPQLVFKDGRKFSLTKRGARMSSNHPGVWEVEVNLAEERDFSQLVDKVRMLRLSASLKDYYGKMARATAVASAQHTPHNVHLHLATSTHFPKVGEFLVLHVRCNFYMESFRYVVLSKGILLDHGQVNMEVPLHTFPLAITPEMAPEATVMIYHLTWYGQLVSDTLHFPVSAVASNNLTVFVARTNHPHRPAYEVEVVVKGRPGATVGLAAYQSSLYHSAAGTDVSSYKLQRALSQFDSKSARREFTHQWTTEDGRPGPSVHLASHRSVLAADPSGRRAELVVLSDATVPSPVTSSDCGDRGRLPCDSGGCYSNQARCDGTANCEDLSDESGCEGDQPAANSDDFLLRRRNRVESDFRPSWLWSQVTVGSNGHVILQTPGPNVTSRWSVSSIGIGETLGLGYVHSSVQYSVLRRLETSASLPTSCVLGEQVGLVVTLLNRDHRVVTVNLVLAKSARYRFVSLQEFENQMRRRVAWAGAPAEHRTSVRLQPGQTRAVTLPVQPLSAGAVDVQIYTEYLAEKLTLTRTVHVRLPGVPVLHHTALLAEVTARPYLYTFLEVAAPSPDQLVAGSYRTEVSLTGDSVGPWPPRAALSAAAAPTAEAALYRLLTSLQQLGYLTLTSDEAGALRSSLSASFQDLMAFRRADGAFCLYGPDQPASVWMTAHVVRGLSVLYASARHQRTVLDVEVLSAAARWLVMEQQESGAFRERGLLPDQRYNDTRDVIMTSHVVLALTEVLRVNRDGEEEGTGESEQRVETAGIKVALSSAAELLLRERRDLSALQACAAALALVRCGGEKMTGAGQKLLAKHVRDEGEFIYWSARPHPLPAYRVRHNVPYLQPRRTFSDESANVLTTALALRAWTALRLPRTEAVVRWLTARRYTDTGWWAEMDSLAVTEALLEYSAVTGMRLLTDVYMDVEADRQRSSLHAHSDTAGVRQSVATAAPSGGLQLRLTGSGVAVAQLTVRYRVATLQERGPIVLHVDAAQHSAGGSHLTIGVCVRWSENATGAAGAALLRLDVPSGYGVSPAVLDQYVHSGLVPGLQSARLVSPPHQLQMVYDQVTITPSCARITVVRWFAVANLSQTLSASVHLIHQPERRTKTVFDVSALAQYGLCDVCGSYQCSSCSVTDGSTSAAARRPLPPAAALLAVLVLLLQTAPPPIVARFVVR